MTDRLPVLFAVCGVAAGCVDYRVKRFGDGGAPISEVAESAKRQSDFWEASKTDLLFFGDTSDSMTAELETMGENARAFMDRLDDYNSDWRMAVVTGPTRAPRASLRARGQAGSCSPRAPRGGREVLGKQLRRLRRPGAASHAAFFASTRPISLFRGRS